MSTDIALTASFYRLLNWFEVNRQRALAIVGGLVLLILVVSYYLWSQDQKKDEASEALSAVTSPDPAGFLKVAGQYPGSAIAPRAVLMAASDYFTTGQYDNAQTQFQRLLQDYPDSPFRAQAYMGLAACADAQGKTADAIQDYKDLMQRYPSDDLIPQVRSALARLYEESGHPEQAIPIYQEQARSQSYNTMGLEANIRLQALLAHHPELASKSAATPAPPANPNPVPTTP
jgi:tetratricopeptide (TPR) repeat protein